MSLIETVCQYLDDEHWAYSLVAAKSMAYFDVSGAKGTLSCVLLADEELQCLSLLTQLGVTVPAIKRLRMADYIARVNYSLLLGCFELSVESGDLRFRISMPLAGSALSRQQLRDTIATSIYTVDRYYTGVMMLVYRNATASEAMRASIQP